MKTLALFIAATTIAGLLALAYGAARIHPGVTWAGVALLGAGLTSLYFSP